MLNSSFLDYRMPTSLDLPMVEAVVVEVANPGHPYGVRGVGEAPIVPPMAAIANAICDAAGVRMMRLADESGKHTGSPVGEGVDGGTSAASRVYRSGWRPLVSTSIKARLARFPNATRNMTLLPWAWGEKNWVTPSS